MPRICVYPIVWALLGFVCILVAGNSVYALTPYELHAPLVSEFALNETYFDESQWVYGSADNRIVYIRSSSGDVYWSNNDGKDFVLISIEKTMERINTTTNRVWRMAKGALMPDGSNVMYFWSAPSDRAPGYQQLLWTTKNGGLSFERRPLFPPNIDMILPHPKYPGVALLLQTTTIPGRNQLFKTLNGGLKIDPIFKPLILSSRVTWIPTRQHPHRFVAGALLGITSATNHYWNNKVLVTDNYFQSYRLYLDHVFDWQVYHYKDTDIENLQREDEATRVMANSENVVLIAESGDHVFEHQPKSLAAAYDSKDPQKDLKSDFVSEGEFDVDSSRRSEDFLMDTDPEMYPMVWPENESETELRIMAGRYPAPNQAPNFEYARNPGVHWERVDSEFLPMEFALNGRIVAPSSGWRVYSMRKNSLHMVNWLFASSAIHRVTMEWAPRYSRAMTAGEDIETSAAAKSNVPWPGVAKSYLLLSHHKPSTYIEFPLFSGVIVADQFHHDHGKVNGAWFTKISTNFGKSWKKLISPDSNATHPRHLVFTGITNAQPLVYSVPYNLGVIFATAATVSSENNLPLNYSQGNRPPVSTYVSNDAGIHWKELGTGYHVPEFAANGAMWITSQRNGNLVSQVNVSADDSQTWVSLNFTQIPVRIYNIRVAGDYNSRNVLIYAWRSWSDTHPFKPPPPEDHSEVPIETPVSHPLSSSENGNGQEIDFSSFVNSESSSQGLNLEGVDIEPNAPEGAPISTPPTTEPPTSPPYSFESLLFSLDFTNSFPDCTESDYELWTPTDHDGREICLLGEKVKFKRRKAGHHCFPQSPPSLTGGQAPWPVVSSREACSCTLEDYQCAPCFEFHQPTGRCRFICGLEDNHFLLTRYHTAPLYDATICSANPLAFYEWFGSKKIANVKNSESRCVGSTPPGLMDAIIPCSLAPRIQSPENAPGPEKQNTSRIWFRFYSVAFGTLFFLGFAFLFVKNLHHILRLLYRVTNYFYPQYPNFEDYEFDDDDDDDDEDDSDGSNSEGDENEIEMDNLAIPETTTSSDEDEGALDHEM